MLAVAGNEENLCRSCHYSKEMPEDEFRNLVFETLSPSPPSGSIASRSVLSPEEKKYLLQRAVQNISVLTRNGKLMSVDLAIQTLGKWPLFKNNTGPKKVSFVGRTQKVVTYWKRQNALVKLFNEAVWLRSSNPETPEEELLYSDDRIVFLYLTHCQESLHKRHRTWEQSHSIQSVLLRSCHTIETHDL